MSRVLITGAGFNGAHVAGALLAAGRAVAIVEIPVGGERRS